MTKRQITRSQALPKNLFHGTPSMENSPSLTKGMKVIREYIVKKRSRSSSRRCSNSSSSRRSRNSSNGIGTGSGRGRGRGRGTGQWQWQ